LNTKNNYKRRQTEAEGRKKDLEDLLNEIDDDSED